MIVTVEFSFWRGPIVWDMSLPLELGELHVLLRPVVKSFAASAAEPAPAPVALATTSGLGWNSNALAERALTDGYQCTRGHHVSHCPIAGAMVTTPFANERLRGRPRAVKVHSKRLRSEQTYESYDYLII